MNAIKAFRTVPVVVIVQLLSRVLLFVTPWTAAHQTVVRMVLGIFVVVVVIQSLSRV